MEIIHKEKEFNDWKDRNKKGVAFSATNYAHKPHCKNLPTHTRRDGKPFNYKTRHCFATTTEFNDWIRWKGKKWHICKRCSPPVRRP